MRRLIAGMKTLLMRSRGLPSANSSWLGNQSRVVVCHDAPVSSPLYRDSGEPIVTRNNIPFVLPNQSRSARLDDGFPIDANANVVGRNRLKFQIM